MKNKGKQLEKIALLIQQVFKDTANSDIYSNYKLMTDAGEPREFDIVLKIEVNQFKLCIVIECKDHKRPVSAEMIESFYGKCGRVKEINKMVFISSSGFQSGAITSATHYKIQLHTLKEVNTELIASWAPIKQLNMALSIRVLTLSLGIAQSEMEGVKLKDKEYMYFFDEESPYRITKYLSLHAAEKKSKINEKSMERYLAWLDNPGLPREVITFLRLELSGAYIFDTKNRKIPLDAVQAEVISRIVETDPEIEQARVYKSIEGENQAHYVKVRISEDQSAEFILSKYKSDVFYSGKQAGDYHLIKTY